MKRHIIPIIHSTTRAKFLRFDDERKPSPTLLIVIVVVLLTLSFYLSGCQFLNTPAKRAAIGTALLKDAGSILTQAAINGLMTAAQSEINNGKVDFTHSLASGLWSVGTQSNIRQVISDMTAGQTPTLADTAARVIAREVEKGRPKGEVASAVANVISATALKGQRHD